MEYQTGKKYDTRNGFKADIRYLANGYLCGHINSAEGFSTFHWTLDGFVLGADSGFDLIHPKNSAGTPVAAPWEGEQGVAALYDELAERQQPLGEDFEHAIHSNLESLYEYDDGGSVSAPKPINWQAHAEALALLLAKVSEEWAEVQGYDDFAEMSTDAVFVNDDLVCAVCEGLAAFNQAKGV